jgi:hypothetical protein
VRAALCIALSSVLTGCAPDGQSGGPPANAPGAPAITTRSPEIIDLMPAFFRFWDQAADEEIARQVELLKQILIEPHRPFYGELVSVPDDDGLAQYLETLAPAIPEPRQLSREFPPQFERAWRELAERHPQFDPGIPVYIAPSLFTSNGQVRYLEGRYVVMFGLDVSAYLRHNPDWLSAVDDPLLNARHELFHAYHYQVNSEVAEAARTSFTPGERTAPLYFDLWSEGLACFATHRMAPEASLGAILSSDVLAREGPPILSRVARELRLRLDSTDEEEVRDYFFMNSQREDIPRRVAYYIGYEVAAQFAKDHSVEELVRLAGSDLRAGIERALHALEETSR